MDSIKSGDIKVVDTKACEFGYELIMVIPYVHYLYKSGVKVKVTTSLGMEDFYYFLPKEDYTAKYSKRTFSFPTGTKLSSIHTPYLDTTEWDSPDYRGYFKDIELKTKFEKPLVIISNKFTLEWDKYPVNYLDLPTLDSLFSLLTKKYTVLYNRPRPNTVVDDHQPSFALGDYSLIEEKHPDVIDLNKLQDEEEIDYNRLQLILGSKCERFISVQGGTAILSSLFGGTNLVYASRGGEVENNSFENWFNKFADCKVESFNRYNDIINKAKQL